MHRFFATISREEHLRRKEEQLQESCVDTVPSDPVSELDNVCVNDTGNIDKREADAINNVIKKALFGLSMKRKGSLGISDVRKLLKQSVKLRKLQSGAIFIEVYLGTCFVGVCLKF